MRAAIADGGPVEMQKRCDLEMDPSSHFQTSRFCAPG